MTLSVEPVRFPSGDGECVGDLYLPGAPGETGAPDPSGEGDPSGTGVPPEPLPVVVMAHGIGAWRSFGLAPFARSFAERGMAVLVFDYRNFGDSSGEPRNLVWPRRHVQDYLAALDFVRRNPRFNADRIGLWGTSFSGGHVLVAAARSPEGVRAVVSQVPFVSGLASTVVYPFRYQLPAVLLGAWDGLKGLLGLAPTTVAVIREKGMALLASPDSFEGYGSIVPEGTAWSGRVPARVFLGVLTYFPIRWARRVRSPTLMMVAEQDSVCPARASRKAAWRIPDCRLEEFPIGHFEPYHGEWFGRFAEMGGEFLEERLKG